jgi:hypothetical protein
MIPPIPDAPAAAPAFSKVKFGALKALVLALLALLLGVGQGWMASRYYGPGHVAGFPLGMVQGAVMPAALPALLLGKNVPIYASSNNGRPYKIGYIVGINLCGMLFFGFGAWQPRMPRGQSCTFFRHYTFRSRGKSED